MSIAGLPLPLGVLSGALELSADELSGAWELSAEELSAEEDELSLDELSVEELEELEELELSELDELELELSEEVSSLLHAVSIVASIIAAAAAAKIFFIECPFCHKLPIVKTARQSAELSERSDASLEPFIPELSEL